MANPSQSALNGLRKRVSVYVKGLIGLGIAAQTLSSSGGSYLAISRLIGSGISIASQLQRGIVVRIVGAPLMRRRPRGRARASPAEEYPEPSTPSAFGTDARDQQTTEWEDVVPSSLSLAEIDSQPFSLARALPSIVAAQQSTFRALSSVNAAVARVVGGTAFGPSPSRSSPSETSMEVSQRTSPDSFPENQTTTFAGEMPALAVSAAFMGAASSMAFNLSSAAHETTNIALGSQAVGAGFASQQPRPANEGTSFAASSQPPTSPSLLQQSITGTVDTSLVSPQSAGANLGLPGSAGGTSSSPGAAATSASSDLPVTREASVPASLSAEVGGPSSSGAFSSATPSSSAAPGSNADLNAGPYTVPNGFNSVLSTPAVAAASQLSIQVRSLGASGSSGPLPLRASQQPALEEGAPLGIPVVPDQYPSSYPAGAAYSLSGIVASLGLGQQASSAAGSGQALTTGEAPSMQETSVTAGGAQAGEPLGASGQGIPDEPLALAEAGPAYQSSQGPRQNELSSSPALFGGRWIGSLAAATSVGSALMGLLTISGGFPSSDSWVPRAAAPGARGALPAADSHARLASASSADARLVSGGRAELRSVTASASTSASSPGAAGEPGATMHEVLSEGLSQQGLAYPVPAGLPLTAYARDPTAFETSMERAGHSVWEMATLLPGILTPSLGARLSGEPGQSTATDFSRPVAGPGQRLEQTVAGRIMKSAGFGALQIAASLRAVLLAASAATMGARAAGYPASAEAPSARGQTSGLGYLPPRAQGSFVKEGAPDLARRVDLFDLSREEPGQTGFYGLRPSASFGATRLAALQATFASRALFAAGAAGPAVGALTPSGSETSGAALASSAPRPSVGRSPRPASRSGFSVSSAPAEHPTGALPAPIEGSTSALAPLDGSGVPVPERELEAALSSLSREGRTSPEGVFFGLAAVSQALSLAAKLPSAAHLNGSLATTPRGSGIRPIGSQPSRQAAQATAQPQLALEASPRLTESWKSAPEEALTRMLEEQSGNAPALSQETPKEGDDRELRRKIEKMLDEELRRHGY